MKKLYFYWLSLLLIVMAFSVSSCEVEDKIETPSINNPIDGSSDNNNLSDDSSKDQDSSSNSSDNNDSTEGGNSSNDSNSSNESSDNNSSEEESFSLLGFWQPSKYVSKDKNGFITNEIKDEKSLLEEFGVLDIKDDNKWAKYFGSEVSKLIFEPEGNDYGSYFLSVDKLTLKPQSGNSIFISIKIVNKDSLVSTITNETTKSAEEISYHRISEINVSERLPDPIFYSSDRFVVVQDNGKINIKLTISTNVCFKEFVIVDPEDNIVYDYLASNEMVKDQNEVLKETPRQKVSTVIKDATSSDLPINKYTIIAVPEEGKTIKESFGEDFSLGCAYTAKSILGAYISLWDQYSYVMMPVVEDDKVARTIDFIISNGILKPMSEAKIIQSGRVGSYTKSKVLPGNIALSEGCIAKYEINKVTYNEDDAIISGIIYKYNSYYGIDLSNVNFD